MSHSYRIHSPSFASKMVSISSFMLVIVWLWCWKADVADENIRIAWPTATAAFPKFSEMRSNPALGTKTSSEIS